MTIEITKQELARCSEWGALRTAENVGRKDIADYDHSRFNLTNLQSNKVAVLAEYYVYKTVAQHTGWSLTNPDPNHWAAFVKSEDYGKYLGQPDIGGVLEVRRANTPTSPLPVRSKDVEAGASVVQVYVPYSQSVKFGPIKVDANNIQILGYRKAKAVWEGRGSYVPSWSKGDCYVTDNKWPFEDFNMEVFS